ncbi:MAG: hypothetical protein Q9162_002297 [Coniocarpon cinnabarinum]
MAASEDSNSQAGEGNNQELVVHRFHPQTILELERRNLADGVFGPKRKNPIAFGAFNPYRGQPHHRDPVVLSNFPTPAPPPQPQPESSTPLQLSQETVMNNADGAADGAAAESHHAEDPPQDLSQYVNPADVTKTALKLKFQIEQTIPAEVEEDLVTKAYSPVITDTVVATSEAAAEGNVQHCVVFCLLVCKKWFLRLAKLELWDADLHEVRAVACEVIAKRIIEKQTDENRLLQYDLLQRFRIIVGSGGEYSEPANAIERAVDLHALRVIGSSGYQQCINYLWRGWIVQDDQEPTLFKFYDDRVNQSFGVHFDPDRMRVPRYQNALQIIISLAYLALYTIAINTINPTGNLDLIEALLYLFTFGFFMDEALKIYKVGRWAIGFWMVFNILLYSLLAVSLFTRGLAAIQIGTGNAKRKEYNQLSYNFLAITAPMFWTRLIFYLDNFKFFGAMLIVFKNMMTESVIFFAILFFELIGFFQAFIGLDLVDESLDKTQFIVQSMANAIMSSPDFSGFDNFAPPFGLALFYLFSFIIMVMLLNILIALFNSSYEAVSSNANDEYLALFAQKTLNFVRAPDEHVYIPPLNLVEIFGVILPFEWWMSSYNYDRLNYYVMAVIYAPLLLITSLIEKREAKTIAWNRNRGEADDDTIEEWEVTDWQPARAEEAGKFVEKVAASKPDLEKIEHKLDELVAMAKAMAEEKENA